jgi:ATP-binding cassette subfamily B protein
MLYIDDCDIMDWQKKDLRENTGYVLQEGFLFSGSVKENIAFSEKEPGEMDFERVRKSASFANVDKDIMEFVNQYDTVVGEKGATLSGGQRQRVSIARAIYKDPSMLILDDSLSAVDADTEKAILANIKSREKKLTTFIIAHRISAIETCDLILVLDNGKLVGKGKHDELYKSCALYHDLCELQKLEKEVN